MAEIRKLASQDDSYVFNESLPVSRTFLRAIQDQTPAFETKYAREELKGSISNIVREMKARITQLKKEGTAT